MAAVIIDFPAKRIVGHRPDNDEGRALERQLLEMQVAEPPIEESSTVSRSDHPDPDPGDATSYGLTAQDVVALRDAGGC